jgi:flagellar export protein FliJ
MSRFQFRLSSLLRLREHTEDQARQDLAASQRTVQSIEDELEDLAARRRAAAGEAFGPTEFSPLTALQAGYAHSHLLGEQEATQQDRLAEATQEQERSRGQALEAHRATELLKRLRERQQERHATEKRRAEDRRTDEAGTQIAVRKSGGS